MSKLTKDQMRAMVTCGVDHVDEIRMVGAVRVNSWHEAARAKDAELIQKLVNALEYVASYDNGCPLPTWEDGYNEAWDYANAVRREAEGEGFAPEDL